LTWLNSLEVLKSCLEVPLVLTRSSLGDQVPGHLTSGHLTLESWLEKSSCTQETLYFLFSILLGKGPVPL
jgi:hypothetical protein